MPGQPTACRPPVPASPTASPTPSRRPADGLSPASATASPTASHSPVPPPDSADTPSDSFSPRPKKQRPPRRTPPRCTATTQFGQPCRAFARKQPRGAEPAAHPVCIYHDPDYASQLQQSAVQGGRAYARRFGPMEPLDQIMSLPINLGNRASIQGAIDGVLRMQLTGQLPEGRGKTILQLLNLALKNASNASGSFAQVYADSAGDFRRISRLAIQNIAGEDLRRRVNEISDVKSKREAFLQANDEFGYPYHVEKR